jgi:hypothetical protein
MDNSPETITSFLKSLRERAGLSMDGLARALGYAAASSYQRYEDAAALKAGYLKRDFVAKLATILVGRGTPPIAKEEVWELAGPEFTPSVIGRQTAFPPQFVPGDQLVTNDRSLPIYPAAMGGDGHVIITFDPIEYVKRPAVLEHVKDGYGLYIVGDSMIPAYKPGETALVHPRLPPARDTDVVLFHTPPHAEAECIIKQLNTFNDKEWMLEQFRPPMEFTESRKEWPICHRVVGKYNRR